jgi:hypothetical protein
MDWYAPFGQNVQFDGDTASVAVWYVPAQQSEQFAELGMPQPV